MLRYDLLFFKMGTVVGFPFYGAWFPSSFPRAVFFASAISLVFIILNVSPNNGQSYQHPLNGMPRMPSTVLGASLHALFYIASITRVIQEFPLHATAVGLHIQFSQTAREWRMKPIQYILYTLTLTICISSGDVRTWTSSSGKTLEGKFVKEKYNIVYIETSEGSAKKIKLSDLSQADREWIKQQTPLPQKQRKHLTPRPSLLTCSERS